MRPLPVSRRVASAIILVASAVAAAGGGALPDPASPAVWRKPALLTTTDAPLIEPVVLADSSGAVHLFFAAAPAGQARLTSTLRYARWADGRWSDPVTVLAPRNAGPIVFPSLALDDRGWLHAVYAGPHWNRIEHRRVPIGEIADAEAWSLPTTLSEDSGLHSAVTAGAGDKVYVLYASHSHHVFFHRSEDGGRTWSAPLRLSDLDAAKIACDNPHLSVDARGRLHAVWTQFRLPIGWPPVGSYYRRSDDGGRTWLPGREVAGEGNGQISVIARGADEVHLVWTAVDTGDRMHSRSPDGGTTWSPPLAIGNGVRGAFTRGLALAFDGGGGLHLVTSTGDLGGEQPIVHTVWDGTAWAEPERISARVAGARPKGLPSLAIGGGNVLHVAYKADDEAIWYTQHKIAAPAIAARPVPTRVTDLWTRAADTSLPFRVLVIVLVFLGGEATVSWLRRRQRETRS